MNLSKGDLDAIARHRSQKGKFNFIMVGVFVVLFLWLVSIFARQEIIEGFVVRAWEVAAIMLIFLIWLISWFIISLVRKQKVLKQVMKEYNESIQG